MVDENVVELLATRNGENLTIKVNNYVLHSLYNPIVEAQKFAEKHYRSGHLHVLYGLGMGYIGEALVAKMSEQDYLLILEPSLLISEQAQRRPEVQRMLAHSNVRLLLSTDEVVVKKQLRILFQQYKGKYCYIPSLNYDKAFPINYQAAIDWYKETVTNEIIHLNTRRLFATDWQMNYIHNLYTAFESQPIHEWKQITNRPVVIASGGPSLTKQIPLLKKYRDHFLLLCAGSTINTLLAADIAPDLIVSIDGGISNFNHFEKLVALDIPLAFSLKIHEQIPKRHIGSKIVFDTEMNRLSTEFIRKLYHYDMDSIMSGPSVANTALALACYLSTGPIGLVGQDLAYTNNLTHAAGNLHHQQVDERYLQQKNVLYTDGYYGEQVLTDRSLLAMKRWFEEFVRGNSEHHSMFNCTEGGVNINGMTNLPFAQFLSMYCSIAGETFNIQQNVRRYERSYADWLTFHDVFSNVLNNIVAAQKVAQKAHRQLKRSGDFTPQLNKKLDQYDKALKSYMEDGFLSLILTPMIESITYALSNTELYNEQQKRKLIYNKSLMMYEQIGEAIAFVAPQIGEVLQRVQEKIDFFKKGNG